MAYSFTWLYAALAISLLLTLFATFVCFFAPGYLTTSTSTSVTANNNSAKSFLYGSGIIGIVVILLFLFSFYNIYTKNVNDMSPIDVINQSFFGVGTLILALLIFLLIVLMLFFIIYAISLIDPSENGSSARWWALAAAVMMVIVLILSLVSFYMYYSFNAYLTALLTEPLAPMIVETPIVANAVAPTQGSLANIIFFSRNPNKKGEFDGTISLKGTFKNDPIETQYNGTTVKNLATQQIVPIDVTYRLEESIKPVVVATVPVVVPVTTVPVRQVVPVQRQVVRQVPVRQQSI